MDGMLKIRVLIGSAALAAGLIAGMVGTAVASSDSDGHLAAPAGPATTNWPMNASGFSYGSGLNATSPSDEPDFIQAYATNGQLGYVKRGDVSPAAPSSPQEALRQQAALSPGDQSVPVYKVDGITQIGVFIIQHGPPDSVNVAPANQGGK